MNSLAIQAQFDPESKNLYAEIMIDDQPLVNPKRDDLAIDLVELNKTLEQGGEFFIITCTCGDAGCAGIERGVQVHHESAMVQWQFSVRQADSSNVRTVFFVYADYLAAIRQGLAQFAELYELHPDAEIVPYLMREQIASFT